MSVLAEVPEAGRDLKECTGCGGGNGAPLASVVHVFRGDDVGVSMVLCEECGRDLANAVGFMCLKEGGWSKLEPRKRKAAR